MPRHTTTATVRNLLRLSTEFLPYDFAVWCEAKLVTVAIDSPIRYLEAKQPVRSQVD